MIPSPSCLFSPSPSHSGHFEIQRAARWVDKTKQKLTPRQGSIDVLGQEDQIPSSFQVDHFHMGNALSKLGNFLSQSLLQTGAVWNQTKETHPLSDRITRPDKIKLTNFHLVAAVTEWRVNTLRRSGRWPLFCETNGRHSTSSDVPDVALALASQNIPFG